MPSLRDMLLPYQRRFVDSTSRRKIWLSSRQIGKSFACAYTMARKALTKPNSLTLCISTGLKASVEMMRKVRQFAEAVKLLTDGAVTAEFTQDTVRWSNGSRVMCLPSGNPQGLRGWSADLVVIDECAFIDDCEEVFQAIGPTLTRNPDAELVITTTPAGMNGWFYDLYSGADEDWYVQTTTVHDAIRDGLKVDLEQLRKLCPDPDAFAQEYECVFAKSYGAMLDVGLLEFYEDEDTSQFASYMGMDVGSTSDRTVITDLRTQDGDVFYVNDPVTLHRTSYEDQLKVLAELNRSRRFRKGYVDQNGIGSAVAEFAGKKVSALIEGFTWTQSNKTQAYEALRSLVFQRKLKFPKRFEDFVRDDFRNVRRIVSESGQVKYEAGRNADGHSDFVSSLALAVQAAKKVPFQTKRPESFARTSPFGSFQRRF